MRPNDAPDPERWVDEYGDYLYRYALSRLRSPGLAEDAVQDTFLAALASLDSFEGRASFGTWLTSILGNKIIDQMRKGRRELPLDPEENLDDLFLPNGHARQQPQRWAIGDPGTDAEWAEFRERLQRCLRGLPERAAHVFVLREMEGLDSKAICKALEISSSNYWVLLHRARLGLRACLEKTWFRAR